MGEKRILVVDDEPIIAALIKTLLGKYGYKVDNVTDALSGIKAASKTKYQVVMSDIKIPGNDGIWFLKEIKKEHPDTQVIMLTASDNLDDVIEALNLGAERYLLKPVNNDELILAVGKVFEKSMLIIRDRNHKIWMEKKLIEQKGRIKHLFLGSIESLAISLDAKDNYTEGHSERVTELSTAFSKFINVPQIGEKIKIAASLHDIGKIGIKESILNKPGKLTDEEYGYIKKHPVISEQIVTPVIEDKDIRLCIRHHHERFDGKGYPDGLKKDKISLGARIIALSDSFDAMTSNRPYRKAFSKEETIRRIEENIGTQFDPELAKKFLKMLN